jgi:hypothetical protein
MQMLFESSFSFCTQQVTTTLQSGEAATAGEEGVNRTVARQSSRAAPAGVHHEGPRGAHAITNRIFRSGTTADGSRQQQHKIGKNARS